MLLSVYPLAQVVHTVALEQAEHPVKEQALHNLVKVSGYVPTGHVVTHEVPFKN